ncbi:MAG: endonuclease domain-containing protein [Tannerellaceae bacterium]|nr:endonuclease domain-containing protein [Tannerellaceae bacterium]
MRIYYEKYLKKIASDLRKDSTCSEKKLWQYLKGNQLGFRFIRQKPIGKYIVDFYCKEKKLAIELDGLSHIHEEVLEKDRIKEQYLYNVGIQTLRFTDKEVDEHIENVLLTIRQYLIFPLKRG